MLLAATLRYINLPSTGVWNERWYIMNDYMLMAKKLGVGLITVMTEHDIDAICDACDGLFVPGSSTDIDPAYYGMPPLPTPPVVDEYALDAKLITGFLARKKPIFGICGGHQELNIYFGGTIKRLADSRSHANHGLARHTVYIENGSIVHDVFGAETAAVNCYHGWELGRLAPDLSIAARTADGCIEAIENKKLNVFSTQWHPEHAFRRGDPIERQFFVNFLRRCEECR